MRCNNEYPLTDGRVNVRLTTNASQAVTSSSQPDSFGVGSVTAGTASAYAYGGAAGYREEGIAPAGLSTAYALEKVGARYYDQGVRGVLDTDTDLSQKPYAYCNGDPVNNCDPSGHLSIVNIASGGGAANTEGIGGAADGYGQGEQDAASSSSSGGSTAVGSSSGSGTGGTTESVTTSGLSSTLTVTAPTATLQATSNDGHLSSVAASGSLPLNGILNGFSITYSNMVNLMPGINKQTVGLSYQTGIVKISVSGDSAGGFTAMAGISTH